VPKQLIGEMHIFAIGCFTDFLLITLHKSITKIQEFHWMKWLFVIFCFLYRIVHMSHMLLMKVTLLRVGGRVKEEFYL
jgi:hypothetical protein